MDGSQSLETKFTVRDALLTNCFNACARNDATSLGQRNTNKARENRDGMALLSSTLTVAVMLRRFAGD